MQRRKQVSLEASSYQESPICKHSMIKWMMDINRLSVAALQTPLSCCMRHHLPRSLTITRLHPSALVRPWLFPTVLYIPTKECCWGGHCVFLELELFAFPFHSKKCEVWGLDLHVAKNEGRSLGVRRRGESWHSAQGVSCHTQLASFLLWTSAIGDTESFLCVPYKPLVFY